MVYGYDYKVVLKDFIVFVGKVFFLFCYVFGYWWLRYWSYLDKEMC